MNPSWKSTACGKREEYDESAGLRRSARNESARGRRSDRRARRGSDTGRLFGHLWIRAERISWPECPEEAAADLRSRILGHHRRARRTGGVDAGAVRRAARDRQPADLVRALREMLGRPAAAVRPAQALERVSTGK